MKQRDKRKYKGIPFKTIKGKSSGKLVITEGNQNPKKMLWLIAN